MADKQRWQDEPFFESDEASPFDDWDPMTGRFTKMALARAIQMWSTLNDRDTTATEAAKVFNVAKWKVLQAVEEHPWMFLNGDTIVHEGE